MKAIQYASLGGPEVLELVDLPVPEPVDAQVRVAVRAAGVNPADWKMRAGFIPGGPLPRRAGFEVAGVVDAVGPQAHWKVGDEVLGWGAGGYADYAVGENLVAKPEELSFAEAAAVPVAAATAARGLHELDLQAGETLLVHGASGAVGAMAVQFARRLGATVIGTASAANQQVVTGLGALATTYGAGLADRVRALQRTGGPEAAAERNHVGSRELRHRIQPPDGVDAVLDCAGHDFLDTAIELRGGTDRIVTFVDPAAASKGVAFSAGGPPDLDAVERAADLLAVGTFHLPAPPRTYPLADAARAQIDSETGRALGKIVLLTS
ncbi:NADP-dependent oxidoreductase [Nocardia stercoris]|uniref:NADP-dependent oxidoreductase n=1 Tax=Nocardia stercoris TaxID=2483361 RepID=A0A3M2LDK4_9NOCA|nr:NADP-dependent oxidoreductase [Nocardia stercoris]RMI34045.1 NADP-dependent oxidoreductase [Nocardia stercoris]